MLPIQETLDLCVCCIQCCKGRTDISFDLVNHSHRCSKNILLARKKDDNNQWKHVALPPKFPKPSIYAVCWFYTEGRGCKMHGAKCTFARSNEEAAVWNFIKRACIDLSRLISILSINTTTPVEQQASGCHEVLKRFLSSHQGTFVELCKTCFHDGPQKISLRVSETCASGHFWSPVLVFCHINEQTKVYNEIRPIPKRNVWQWKFCRYVKKGEPCWHGAHRCWFAHSEIEMSVWRKELSGSVNRSALLHASQMLQTQASVASSHAALQEQKQQHYCAVCKCQLSGLEDFMNHCFSPKHRKLIFEDSSSTWKFRNPPPTSKSFKLCRRLATCEYGDSCVKAHSVEELQEWIDRHRDARRKARAASMQGLLSYQDSLLEEYRQNEKKESIMKESLPGVSVSCDFGLSISVEQEKTSHRWKFKIVSELELKVAALLRCDVGATFALHKNSNEENFNSTVLCFGTQDTSNSIYEITVFFTCDRPGVYEQWLVFDFDMRPVLLQELKVKVGGVVPQLCPQPEENQSNEGTQQGTDSSMRKLENTQHMQLPIIWHEETVEIIPYQKTSEAHQELLKQYSHLRENQPSTVMIGTDLINHQNYKEKMHCFLYQEEKTQDQLVSRLNLRGTMSLKEQLFDNWSGLKNAIPGELFGSIPVSYSLAPDSNEGYMLKRHVQSVLVGLLRPDCSPQCVYEAVILKDVIGESELNVKLSKDCCKKLQLQSNTSTGVEVQFQLDRKWFCEMHKAVDMLPNLRRVLPDLQDRHVPVPLSIKSCPGELNEKQQVAMDFILGASDKSSVAPLLIYGPFGTGKTLTLAKITLALVQQPQNRILICTHTNSSADLYVRNHFHVSATTADHPVRPLRIKAKECSLRTTDGITIQYCYLSKDCCFFEFPDRKTLDASQIIITTTRVARFFHDLQLPSNYFSHIFIDEASQMLECEALMAIGLAGEKTQVILAGDHMQMGPRLFSVGVDKSSDHTLLNRLFHHYQAENTTTAKNSRIIFNENYRSTQEIVDFVSKHFYAGKTDGIKAKGNVPAHPHQNALQFCHVRGKCYLDKGSMSWFNPAEIQTVVDAVLKVLEEWPCEWQQKDPSSMCVLSQGSQVIGIRKQLKLLREHNLHKVTVENAENVQGKQFRVIIMTTVHTKDSLNMAERPRLEFFNDVRLLNTAMTRAQSQVIVIGDAIALCCPYFGKCWRLWNSYINHCIGTGSVNPKEFTLDNLNQELLEISSIMRTEEDSSDSDSTTSELPDNSEDSILKELLDEDEDEDLQIKLTEDGMFPILHNDSFENNGVRQLKKSKPPTLQPDVTWQKSWVCELVLKTFDFGFARPLDKPSIQIKINGRKNLKQSLSGDVVRVEILHDKTCPPIGEVTEVIKRAETPSEFVCTVDKNDGQVMAPINICFPKVFTPFWKDKPNYIAIRNPEFLGTRFIKITEETRRNHLFVVRLIKWGKRFFYPLGIVVKVFPKVNSLQDGLKILEIEYKLDRTVPESVQRDVEILKQSPLSLNGREDFRELRTFTIDSSSSKDLDDAISVRDLGEHYEIGVHIADVASFVPKDSNLDKFAKQQGTSIYVSKSKPAHMFPKDLSTDMFSLLEGFDRHCISLMIVVDKQTNHIQTTTFYKSVICSKMKFSYEAAEEILKSSGTSWNFDTLKGCLAIACDFAEVHRKERKQEDWCYRRPDEDEVVGSRRSHRLVEELMIMFNHFVADKLLTDRNTKSLAPLRCQDMPDRDQLHDFQDRNFARLSMSIHLSSHVGDLTPKSQEQPNLSEIDQTQNTETKVFDNGLFPILTSVLKNLEIAARDKDIHRIVDLITTDDLHPQLLPLVIDLRRLINKAQVLRANSSHLSRIGHYDLQLDSYTWASSPIRRYIDVIVQRLLLSVLDNTEMKYTSNEIDLCCVEFSQKTRVQTTCEKKSHALGLASQLSMQNALKVAYIVEVTPTSSSFRISMPLNEDLNQDMNNIMYRDLQLADQPLYDEMKECMVIKWVRRIYSFADNHIHNNLKEQQTCSAVTYVPNNQWKDLVAAIKKEDWKRIYKVITDINATVTRQPIRKKTQKGNMKDSETVEASRTGASSLEEKHFKEFSLELKKGDIIEVQLGTDTDRGLLVPAVQLLIVNQEFEVCLGHTKDPINCFSKYAFCASKTSYRTYVEYQTIWKPLCEMESAYNAVTENESIVLEETILEWNALKENANLQGCFHLTLEQKKTWAIECNLRKCFLCIRLRIQHSSTDTKDLNPMHSSGLIWIGHGIVTNVSGEEESKKQGYMKIDFCINHMPMTKLPEFTFLESARYTVELIPKLLPDIRKESAVLNLTMANDLVKAIATGKRTSNTRHKQWDQTVGPSRLEIKDQKSLVFPELNYSQCRAIREALRNEFTLIQGPPGTGKTVVGVHIVYWFFQENQKLPPLHAVEGEQKKRCILYCGPSNKSVDVVAGQLLKLEQKLKPLRIYGDQVEILEFPYPGSNLNLSRQSQRVEKPKEALRSISLHHKIRMPSNPYADQIKAFDLKVQQKENITPEETERYKKILGKARKHELLLHDVVLCTCTAASRPILAKVLSIQQIIIDECAMATEPEALIPLVTHKPKQIVFLGDHKQLQPVVNCELLKRLGMRKSLFERYTNKALMLDTQYRMQETICEFPSNQFYDSKLKTGTKHKPSVFFRTKSNISTSIIFGHVGGEEISLVVSTERGDENSKANIKEANAAVRIAMSLIQAGIETKDIAILTPYNAQVAKINEIIAEKKVKNITVSSIMKSQGSEWRYVILTTVRSCEKIDIEDYQTKSWRQTKLGFVEDPHQVNVGITRAQDGLCIIGNKDLLMCSFLWKKLLNHYETKGCVVDPAEKIQIR